MLSIQVWRWGDSNEELGSVRVRSRIGLRPRQSWVRRGGMD